jgi:hypothetical protein
MSADGTRNIQIIDSAMNCTFSLFQATDAEFALIFPEHDQDIEYSEDLTTRLGMTAANNLLSKLWQRPIERKNIVGIHGTLFFGLSSRKAFYSGKRHRDIDAQFLSSAERRMFEASKAPKKR